MVRQRRILRFLRAKQHSAQLVQLMKRLEQANQSFTVSILSLDASWVMLMDLDLTAEDDAFECRHQGFGDSKNCTAFAR